jgi:hypothetical protein
MNIQAHRLEAGSAESTNEFNKTTEAASTYFFCKVYGLRDWASIATFWKQVLVAVCLRLALLDVHYVDCRC